MLHWSNTLSTSLSAKVYKISFERAVTKHVQNRVSQLYFYSPTFKNVELCYKLSISFSSIHQRKKKIKTFNRIRMNACSLLKNFFKPKMRNFHNADEDFAFTSLKSLFSLTSNSRRHSMITRPSDVVVKSVFIFESNDSVRTYYSIHTKQFSREKLALILVAPILTLYPPIRLLCRRH